MVTAALTISSILDAKIGYMGINHKTRVMSYLHDKHSLARRRLSLEQMKHHKRDSNNNNNAIASRIRVCAWS